MSDEQYQSHQAPLRHHHLTISPPRLSPMLHVDDPTMASAAASNKDVFEPAALEANHLRTDLLLDGVFIVPPEGLDWQVDLSAMAAAAKILHEHGLPPHALLMYDEPWVMVRARVIECSV